MRGLRAFWKEWVYDLGASVEWTTPPHDVFKAPARVACVFLGSIVPFGLVLLRSGVLGRLESREQIDLELLVAGLTFLAVWLISIVFGTASEEKTLVKYILIGSVGPANLTILYIVLQGVQ